MECQFCRYSQGHHAANCPEGNKKAEALFWRGYKEGREGLSEASYKNPIFEMGFQAGVIALEEAINGYDPSRDI